MTHNSDDYDPASIKGQRELKPLRKTGTCCAESHHDHQFAIRLAQF